MAEHLEPTATASATSLVSEISPPGDQTVDPSATAAPTIAGTFASSVRRGSERYDILGEHGRGGLGRVSRAHDRDLDRDVAIKELIHRNHVSEVRFLREALITARLEHPGIVPVHEAGRWSDGTPYYAMKLVAGRPLRNLIAERDTVALRLELLHHVIAVADAIAYAHGRNIIHRDLKPANVIVGEFGETVVIDWGLAKDLSTSDEPALACATTRSPSSDLTVTGSVLGTPAYMAPEQERGERVDQRADVFAIGAMLWELCSLQKVPPVDRAERHRLLRQSNIDHDLIAILDKAIDSEPVRRYRDASALAADLKSFKAGSRIAAREYSLPAVLAHWIQRHRALTLAVLIAVIASASGASLYVRNIAEQRNRADEALERVETTKRDLDRQHEELILKHVELLLTKDPTAALDTLATYHGDHIDQAARLRAEALDLGVASLRITPHTNNILWAHGTREGGVITLGLDGAIAHTTEAGHTSTIASNVSAKLTWAYSEAQHILAYSCNSTNICLLDIYTNKQTRFSLGPNNAPQRIAFSPSGRRLATITRLGRLRVFDTTTESFLEVLSRNTKGDSVLPTSDSAYIVGEALGLSLITADHPAAYLASPDGVDWALETTGRRIAIGTSQGAISLIETATLRAVRTQAVCHGAVYRLEFLPKHDAVAYICDDGQVGLWNFDEGRTRRYAQLKTAPTILTVDDTGTYIVVGASDFSVNIIDLSTNMMSSYHGMEYRLVTLTPPSSDYPFVIAGDAFGKLRTWPLPARRARVAAHVDGRFTSAAMIHDTLVALTSAATFATLAQGAEVKTRQSRYQDDLFIARSKTSQSLATYGFSNRARLWTDPSLTQPIEITLTASISQLSPLPNDTWLSADEDGRLVRWTSQGASMIVDDRRQAITSFIIADPQVVIEATIDGTLWAIDLSQTQPERQIRGAGPRITSMALLPNGTSAAIGRADGDVSIFDTGQWAWHAFVKSDSAIRDIVFASDGKLAAIATSGEKLLLGTQSGVTWSADDITWSELSMRARHLSVTRHHKLIIECSNGDLWIYATDSNAWEFISLGTAPLFELTTFRDETAVYALDTDGNVFEIELNNPGNIRHQQKAS